MASEIIGADDLMLLGEEDLLGYEDILGEDLDALLGESYLLGEDDDVMGTVLGARGKRRMTRAQAASARSRLDAQRRQIMQRQRSRPSRAQAVQNMANIRQAGGIAIQQTEPTKGREQVLGFDSVGTIAAGASATLTSRPQVIFRAKRLVVAAAIAPSFLINDLKIGKNSQFVAAGAVPADAFQPTAFNTDMKLDTAQIANDIVLLVTNISGGALRFTAALFGDAAE